MSKQQQISQIKISKAIDFLKALDKKELDDVNAHKTIKNMYSQIQHVLRLGYSYEEVSETLAGLDINISPQRIKYFLAEIYKSKNQKFKSKNKGNNELK